MVKLETESIKEKEIEYVVENLKLINGPARVYVLQGRIRTTLPQFKYYWGVVLEMVSNATGYEKEDIHEFNKNNFGLVTQVEIDGQVIERKHGLRKGKANTKDFIDKVIRHWEEKLGEHIPGPNEMSEEELIKIYNDTE